MAPLSSGRYPGELKYLVRPCGWSSRTHGRRYPPSAHRRPDEFRRSHCACCVAGGDRAATERTRQHELFGAEHFSLDPRRQLAPVMLELPGLEAAVRWRAQVDAPKGGQIARRLGPPADGEVRRRGDRGQWHVGPDRSPAVTCTTNGIRALGG